MCGKCRSWDTVETSSDAWPFGGFCHQQGPCRFAGASMKFNVPPPASVPRPTLWTGPLFARDRASASEPGHTCHYNVLQTLPALWTCCGGAG